MNTISILGIVAFALLLIIILWGAIAVPLFKKKADQKQEIKMAKIIAGLKKDDKILLAAGIRGYFVKIKNDTIYVEISPNVIIRVDKHAVIGIYK